MLQLPILFGTAQPALGPQLAHAKENQPTLKGSEEDYNVHNQVRK